MTCLSIKLFVLILFSNKFCEPYIKEWIVRENSDAMINCFDGQLEAPKLMREYNRSIFDWQDLKTHTTLLGFRKNIFGNGSLKINHVRGSDTGRIECNVERMSDGKKLKFEHVLIVFVIAHITRVYPFVYAVSDCISFASIKENQLLKRLCRLWSDDPGSCPFSISAKCYGPLDNRQTLKLMVEQKIERNFVYPHCSVICIKRVLLAHLQFIAKKVIPFVSHEEIDANKRKYARFRFLKQELLHTNTYTTCESGFQNFRHIMCVPCLPGTYSKQDYSTNSLLHCHLCEKGTYQANFAADECIPCGDFAYTTELGTNSSIYCHDSRKYVHISYSLAIVTFMIGVFLSCACLLSRCCKDPNNTKDNAAQPNILSTTYNQNNVNNQGSNSDYFGDILEINDKACCFFCRLTMIKAKNKLTSLYTEFTNID